MAAITSIGETPVDEPARRRPGGLQASKRRRLNAFRYTTFRMSKDSIMVATVANRIMAEQRSAGSPVDLPFFANRASVNAATILMHPHTK